MYLVPQVDNYTNRNFNSVLIAGLLLLLLLCFGAGCTRDIELSVIKPAEVDTRDIQTVAVGSFELVSLKYLMKEERDGKWEHREQILDDDQKKALSEQIRAQVIGKLSTVPYFDLVYTDEFAELEADAALQDAIAAAGFTTTEADAVINGRVWVDVVRIDGAEPAKTDLAYRQGGGEGTFNYDLEVLVYWPYKSINGTMGLELKMTRLNPSEVIAVTFDTRNYSRKIGGQPEGLEEKTAKSIESLNTAMVRFSNESSDKKTSTGLEVSDLVLPGFHQLVADLSESIAARFVRRVSITQELAQYPIASGGNEAARILIEAGAFEKAIEVLTETLNEAEEQNPDDLYNLGLCFEAIGDYGLASVSYRDAIEISPDRLIFARGAGRIEQRRREGQIRQ